MKPKAPSLLTMPAKKVSTCGGADAYESGSQVWKGTSGTLIANDSAKAMNAHCCGVNVLMPRSVTGCWLGIGVSSRVCRSKVPCEAPPLGGRPADDCTYSQMMASSMARLPATV